MESAIGLSLRGVDFRKKHGNLDLLKSIFAEEGYDFIAMDLFKSIKSNSQWSLDTTEGLQALNDSLALLNDLDLPSITWKKNLLVYVTYSPGFLGRSLDICSHCCVNGVVVDFSLNFKEELSKWLATTKDKAMNIYIQVKSSQLALWRELQYDRNIAKTVKAVLVLEPEPSGILTLWHAECVGLLMIKTDFTDAATTAFVVKCLTQNIPVMLEEGAMVDALRQKLERIMSLLPPLTEKEKLLGSFENRIQAPLQPLQDHLESETYDIFENDSVKYEIYGKAIFKAILNGFVSEKDTLRVAICGAGRGPLVDLVLRCINFSGWREVKIYVLEKNPYAMLTLMARKNKEWASVPQIELCLADMRSWTPPDGEPVNLIISELLGGFADNELSPECLEGAQRFLDKKLGVIIPQEHTSWIEPIYAPKLFSEILKEPGHYAFHSPFSCLITDVLYMNEGPKKAFTFEHPLKEPLRLEYRTELQFTSSGLTVHAFAGYFTAKLFRDVELSIVRGRQTDQMMSWFPVIFPLEEPLTLLEGTPYTLCFSRMNDGDHVWYSWQVKYGDKSTIMHNENGQHSSIGLY